MTGPELTITSIHAAGGYGPPGGGGGGGWGPPPGGGAPPGGGGYGGPPQGPPPGGGGGGYGVPPQGGFGAPPPGGYGGGFGGGGFGGGGGGGFGPPGGGFAPPGGPMGPGAGQDINTTLPLILNIVAMIFCCGLSFFCGVAGLIVAIQAGNALKTGDIETARNKAKTATTLAIVAFVIGVLQIAAGFVSRLLAN